MTDTEILVQVRAALRSGERENMHLRGAWIATAEENFKQIPAPRRNVNPDLLSIGRCLDAASKYHQVKNWDMMTSLINSCNYAIDRVIGPG